MNYRIKSQVTSMITFTSEFVIDSLVTEYFLITQGTQFFKFLSVGIMVQLECVISLVTTGKF